MNNKIIIISIKFFAVAACVYFLLAQLGCAHRSAASIRAIDELQWDNVWLEHQIEREREQRNLLRLRGWHQRDAEYYNRGYYKSTRARFEARENREKK